VGGLVYYSSETGNTHRFVEKLGLPAKRIPISPKDDMPSVDGPFVLVVPTYAAGDGRGALPKQVKRFLSEEGTRRFVRGVIGAGNINFGETYCLGARQVAEKCNVGLLYRFELLGTDEDLVRVKTGLERFWKESDT
jgi:protein involved in ribonucleotide reduction